VGQVEAVAAATSQLYPGYTEPNLDIIVDGTKRRYDEKLHMYVAEARSILAKPQSSRLT
jgi:hypothetical protein